MLPDRRQNKEDPNGCVVVVQGGLASVGVLLSARNPTSVVSRLILTSPPIYDDMVNPAPQDELQKNYNFLTSKIFGGFAFTLLETRPLIKFFPMLFYSKRNTMRLGLIRQ